MDDAEDISQDITPPRAGSQAGARLREAMRRARVAQTVRNDVIVDLRETEIARLEVLADALRPVFAELPEEAEQFECSLVPGATPRLWVDMLAFVDMGRDKRTYRFVSDTRAGRQVMLETTNVADMADRVTDYVAHRLVERERSLAAAPITLAPRGERRVAARAEPAPQAVAAEPASAVPARQRWSEGARIGLAYLAGLLTGAAGIILLALYVTN